MRNLINSLRRRGDDGALAVEYGLLVAAIAAIIILVVFALGTFVKGAFKDTCSAFKNSNTVNSAGSARNNCNQEAQHCETSSPPCRAPVMTQPRPGTPAHAYAPSRHTSPLRSSPSLP